MTAKPPTTAKKKTTPPKGGPGAAKTGGVPSLEAAPDAKPDAKPNAVAPCVMGPASEARGTNPTKAKKSAAKKKSKASYHHGDLRLALLTAARKCLEEKGPAGLSFREVARNAGVSHAAPYHHFADKQELLAALALEAFEGLNRTMDEAVRALVPEATAMQRLVALGRGYVKYACDEPASFKLMWQHDEVDVSKSEELMLSSSAAYRALSERVEEVHAQFSSAPEPPGLDNVLLWSVVHGIASLYLTNALGIPSSTFENVVHATLERAMGAFLEKSDARIPSDAVQPDWPYDPTAH